MKKVNHEELGKLIKTYYNQVDEKSRKIPLLVYGTFGVGKSAKILETGKEIADKKEKDFIEWNSLTQLEKDDVMKNPQGKFVFIDIRLSEYDTSDVKGLPDFKDETSIIWKSPMWAKFICNPNSDGVILFDEINLATPLVISSVYKILYDRNIGESRIATDWLILGAGNLESDNAHTHELAFPVRDRGGEVILSPASKDGWIDNFALKHQIDSRIIGFLSMKPSYLHKVDESSEQKFTTVS